MYLIPTPPEGWYVYHGKCGDPLPIHNGEFLYLKHRKGDKIFVLMESGNLLALQQEYYQHIAPVEKDKIEKRIKGLEGLLNPPKE